MGFLGKKFSTLFRGPYALYWKERREGRRIVGLIILLRRFILQRIPDEVIREHNIKKALNDQDKVEGMAKEVGEKGFRLGFNVELDEEKAFELIAKIEEAWTRVRGRYKSLGKELDRIEADFQAELTGVLEECERETTEIYWKELEPVIKVAEKGGSHMTLMASVALFFKEKDVSRLAATAFRWEARDVRKGLVGLAKDEKMIKRLLGEVGKRGVRLEKISANLRQCVKRMTSHARNEFRSAYLLWKRDFLLNLVLLKLLADDEKEMMQFVIKHIMPRMPEYKNIQDIEAIKRDLARNMHVLAQGFRRLIAEERRIKNIAKGEGALARRAA